MGLSSWRAKKSGTVPAAFANPDWPSAHVAPSPGHGFSAADFLSPQESTLEHPVAFARCHAPPPQSPESLFDRVGHRVHLALLLPVLAVEERALDQPRVVQAADVHALPLVF